MKIGRRQQEPARTVVDRFGEPQGRFANPEGTPWSQRSLPPTALGRPYRSYEVVRALPPEVRQGLTAPWFDQPGGGVRYAFDRPIQDYVDAGSLVEVRPDGERPLAPLGTEERAISTVAALREVMVSRGVDPFHVLWSAERDRHDPLGDWVVDHHPEGGLSLDLQDQGSAYAGRRCASEAEVVAAILARDPLQPPPDQAWAREQGARAVTERRAWRESLAAPMRRGR